MSEKPKRYDVRLEATGSVISVQVFCSTVEDPDGPFYRVGDVFPAPHAEVEALVKAAEAVVHYAFDMVDGSASLTRNRRDELAAALAPFLESRETGTPGRDATEGREG